MYKDNVIKFPNSPENIPIDATALKERMDSVRIEYAEEVSDEALEAMLSIFKSYGFYTREDKMHIKDIVGISEMIKSSLFRYCNIEHPMQKVIDEVIEINEHDPS